MLNHRQYKISSWGAPLMISRRDFCSLSATALLPASVPAQPSKHTVRTRLGGNDSGFDPWIEIDAGRLRHNAAEVARAVGQRPILAVVKNNAYGLGDTAVAPILDGCREIAGIACVRVSEAIAMREAGVKKPILNMAATSQPVVTVCTYVMGASCGPAHVWWLPSNSTPDCVPYCGNAFTGVPLPL